MTSPTNSQLRCLLRPDQTGNGAEVRAVTAFIPSETNDSPKKMSIFALDVIDGLLVGQAAVEPGETCGLQPRPFSARRSLALPSGT
jgi:hypothetical protein